MAQSLDDRIRESQMKLGAEMPQPPISVPDGEPLRRIYIHGNPLPVAQPGEIANQGGGDIGAVPVQDMQGAALTSTADEAGTAIPAPPAADAPLPLPTPIDNTPDLIEQRRKQAIESLKNDGFDGYTPDISRPEQWNMDDQHSVSQAVQDVAAGFNMSLAKALSLPRETVDRALGLLGLDYMQRGSPQQQTIDALNRMGVPTYEVENLANKIGRGALPALATYTAMQLAAPAMAAKQGMGAGSYMLREIGQWALKHPVVGLWLGQASAAGGEVAEHAFGEGTAQRLGGELAGGLAPGAAVGAAKLPFRIAGTIIPGSGPAVRALGKGVGAGIDSIADALPTDLGNAIKRYNPLYQQPIGGKVPDEAIFNPNIDANRIQTFAKDQIHAAQTYQDRAIEQAIESIPRGGTAAQVQNATHIKLQEAEKISKRIVSDFWKRVPLKTKINVGDLRTDINALKKELVDLDNQRPDHMIEKILDTVSIKRGADGRMQPAPKPTVQKLRDLQSQIGTAITEERARDAPREGMVRNLVRISEMIDDNIAKQLPNSTAIEQARQMSKRHNDLFSRGPINDILSKRRTGDFRVPQGDSIDALMQKTDGLAALRAVHEGVTNYPRVPTTRFLPAAQRGNPFAVTPAEKASLDDMIKTGEDAVRTLFREAMDQSPQKGVAWSARNDEVIKGLGKVHGELNFAAQKVAAALAEQKAVKASALARFAETSPDAAVKNIFSQKDPAGTARQLMISFRGDPDALEGLRNQVLKEFIYERGKTNPNLMQKMMMEPRMENLLQVTLAPDQYNRLKRMVDTAVKIGVEDERGFRAAISAPAKTTGSLVGAFLGRRLNTGTLQAPQIFSNRMGKLVERTLGATDPQDMLAQAVLDPNWEKLLYSRIPSTTKDMKKAETHYRRMFAIMDTSRNTVMDRFKGESDE